MSVEFLMMEFYKEENDRFKKRIIELRRIIQDYESDFDDFREEASSHRNMVLHLQEHLQHAQRELNRYESILERYRRVFAAIPTAHLDFGLIRTLFPEEEEYVETSTDSSNNFEVESLE